MSLKNVVVSKIRVYNPNKKSSKHANKGFLKYIATRPGVDITSLDLNEKIENLYLDMSDDKKYLEYITYRPKSHGLFGNVDTTYVDQVANEMYSLTKDGNIIYRGIVSLCEEDARDLGYLDKNKWNTLLRATMPDVSNTLGISISTMKWVAAFHNEEGHPHVHYMLWDSRKRVASPYIHVAKQQRCREILSKEIFQDERVNLVIEKTVERDDIIKLAKNITKDSQEYVLNINSLETIPQRIPKRIGINEAEEIAAKLERLVDLLPEHGRINYAFVPKEVKAYTDEIVDMIFKRKDVSKELNSFLKHNEKISQTYSALDEKVQRATSKAYLDIERRIQNVVLNAAKELRKSNYKKADNIGSIVIENKSYNKVTMDEDKTLIEIETGVQSIEENFQTNTYSKLLFENDNVKKAREIINNVYSKKEDYRKALKLFSIEASKGNIIALTDIGKMYAQGLGVKKDIKIAGSFMRRARQSFLHREENESIASSIEGDGDGYNESNTRINLDSKLNNNNGSNDRRVTERLQVAGANISESNHHVNSQYLLSKINLRSENNEEKEKSLNWFKEAAEGGNEFAQYTLGKVYLSDEYGCKDTEKAMYYLNLSADQGNSFAQYTLGKVYLSDEYKIMDINKAVEYLIESADQDNEYAQYTLGKIYISEVYDCKDINKGTEYLLKSADHGNSFAQYTLGKIFIDKESNFFNIKKVFEYLELSEKQGNEYAQNTLGKLYLDKNSPYFNEKLGLDYLKKATDQNNVYAIYTLGKIYMDENYKCYNEEQGMEYIERAAKLGFDCAQYVLGKIYMDKESKCYDEDKALYWLSKSSDDNEYSKYSLARLLLRDDGKHYDPDRAITLLYEAANNNNSYAQLELAKQFLYGKHLEKDREKAEYWLNKALEDNNPEAQEFVTYRKEIEERMFKQKIMSFSFKLIQSCFSTVNANKEMAKYELDQEILRASRKNAKKSNHHKEKGNEM